jgi:hypothetical protein
MGAVAAHSECRGIGMGRRSEWNQERIQMNRVSTYNPTLDWETACLHTVHGLHASSSPGTPPTTDATPDEIQDMRHLKGIPSTED